jgi:hypothetical protein
MSINIIGLANNSVMKHLMYQKKFLWLTDHGDTTGDEAQNFEAGSSNESCSN